MTEATNPSPGLLSINDIHPKEEVQCPTVQIA